MRMATNSFLEVSVLLGEFACEGNDEVVRQKQQLNCFRFSHVHDAVRIPSLIINSTSNLEAQEGVV